MTASGTPPQRELVSSILESAAGLPAAERASFVDRACAEDAALHAEVSSLMAHMEPSETLFGTLSAALGGRERPASALVPGAMMGHYRITKRIGGGMTTVYEAWDTEAQEAVALKVAGMPVGGWTKEDIDARMRLEARILGQLSHPATCRLRALGETTQGRPFLALEFIRGEPLNRRLGRGPLPAGEVAGGGARVAGALAEAHAHGIIHRDVKPANVMVDELAQFRILDFGAAKSDQTHLTARGRAIGTLEYMSPEQLQGAEYGAATDVWSLSVLMLEALVGKHPFRGSTLRETLGAISARRLQVDCTRVESAERRILAEFLQGVLATTPQLRPTALALSETVARLSQ